MAKKKQKLLTKLSHYTTCPNCALGNIAIDFDSRDDLFLYPSFCDSCGAGYYLTLSKDEVELETSGDQAKHSLVFLKCNNMLMVVKDRVCEEDLDTQEIFYCDRAYPDDYFRNTVAVVDLTDKEVDPRGLFEYITTVVIKEHDLKEFEKNRMTITDLEKLTGLPFEELTS